MPSFDLTSNTMARFQDVPIDLITTHDLTPIFEASSITYELTIPSDNYKVTFTTYYNLGNPEINFMWGDGDTQIITSMASNSYVDFTHTYSKAGVYTFRVVGTFIYFAGKDYQTSVAITKVKDWSRITQVILDQCINLTEIPAKLPGEVTNISISRSKLEPEVVESIRKWDVPSVTLLSFSGSTVTIGDLDLSHWNVSNLTQLSFSGISIPGGSLKLANWNLPKVTSLEQVFSSIKADSIDASNWNTPNVTNMKYVAYYSTVSKIDMSNWNMSKVTTIAGIFQQTTNLIEIKGIEDWNFASLPRPYNSSNTNGVSYTLEGAFYNTFPSTWTATSPWPDLSGWNVKNVNSPPWQVGSSYYDFTNRTAWPVSKQPQWGTKGKW